MLSLRTAAVSVASCFVLSAQAGNGHGTHSAVSYADSHAPIGVMGDHMHKTGEWMFSYRYMTMHMDGNRDGTSSISPNEIATTVSNRFFGQPMQPPTLRVVPLKMDMDMHMVGAMYAPNDDLTLMVMANYVRKVMEHRTYMGGMGTTVLGHFTTVSEGIGDTKVMALYRLRDSADSHLHLNIGLSLPTGSIKESDAVLTPMNMRPTLRLPYPMQLGTGTYDFIGGATYTGKSAKWSWGGQYLATIRMGRNSEDYAHGDEHKVTAWTSYRFHPVFSGALRLQARTLGKIDGIDDQIVAPVQTADPDNQGGDQVDLSVAFNVGPQKQQANGTRLALEFTRPVYRDLNGPQMETDWSLMLGLQKAF